MHRWLAIPVLICAVFTAVSSIRGDDQSEVVKIIKKAIKASGGRKTLKSHQAVSWNEKGTYYGMGEATPYTGHYAVQWPGKFRMEIVGVFTIVLNGEKGWIASNSGAMEMTKDQLAEQQEQHYVGTVLRLTSLTNKEFKLSPLGESKVDDRTALGVKVTHEGHRDVELFFDKQTGLLMKSQHIVKADELGGKEVTQATLYQNYKEVDGEQIAMKMTLHRDGKKFVVAEMSEVKLAEKVDDSLFDKP